MVFPVGAELFLRLVVAERAGAVLLQGPHDVGSPTFRALNPEPLVQGPYVVDQGGQGSRFDIAPDGERFLMRKPGGATPTDDTAEPDLVVVFNRFDELKRLVPTGRPGS